DRPAPGAHPQGTPVVVGTENYALGPQLCQPAVIKKCSDRKAYRPVRGFGEKHYLLPAVAAVHDADGQEVFDREDHRVEFDIDADAGTVEPGIITLAGGLNRCKDRLGRNGHGVRTAASSA